MDEYRKYFSYFAAVFDVGICDSPEDLQMELIELQSQVSSNQDFERYLYSKSIIII